MKQYTFEVVVDEGCDEFWEGLKDKSGCDEILNEIAQALWNKGFQSPSTNITLKKFEDI